MRLMHAASRENYLTMTWCTIIFIKANDILHVILTKLNDLFRYLFVMSVLYNIVGDIWNARRKIITHPLYSPLEIQVSMATMKAVMWPACIKPRSDKRDFLSRGAVGGTTGRRVLIGLVDFQPSVAINAARIRATRRFRHADHRNRSGTDFFRAAPRNCVPVDRNSYTWHPDATLINQSARGTAGDSRVNCNRIPRAAVYDIPPAPPGDSAGQKVALIATGLITLSFVFIHLNYSNTIEIACSGRIQGIVVLYNIEFCGRCPKIYFTYETISWNLYLPKRSRLLSSVFVQRVEIVRQSWAWSDLCKYVLMMDTVK